MNEHRERRGPHPGLLLLIPAAVIIAKGARRRRARWESSWSGPSGFSPRYGSHGHFGARGGPSDAPGPGMPPWIAGMLDAWHAKAHEQADAGKTTTV